MALARTNVGAYASSTSHGTGAFATSSFTPPHNSLLVVGLHALRNGSASNFMSSLTLAGGSLTWTKQDEQQNGDWRGAAQLWTAPVAEAASMTLSLDCGAIDIYEYIAHVLAFKGYNTASPVGAKGRNGSNSATGAMTVTFDAGATSAATSEVVGFVWTQDEPAGAIGPGTGYTEHFENSLEGGNIRAQIQSALGARTTATWASSVDGTFGRSAVAIEIKAAGGFPYEYAPMAHMLVR